MQGAREHLLADTGLAQQQHRHLAARRLADQRAGLAEAGGGADQVVGAQVVVDGVAQVLHLFLQLEDVLGERVRPQVALDILGIFPFLGGLADDAAGVRPAGAALGLLIEDAAAHHRGRVAAGVAGLHPAGGAGIDAEQLMVQVGLEGAVPEELAVEAALGDVDVEPHRAHGDDALEGVQLRPHAEQIGVRSVRIQLARQFCVARPGGEAGTRQHAASALGAERVDQFLAQRRHGGAVQQDHPRFTQPDMAVVVGKPQP